MSGFMLKIGQFNKLTVIERFAFGFYLQCEADSENKVLLTNLSAPKECQIGDTLDLFVYHDNDDRLIGTNKTPKAQLGDVAALRVVSLTSVGAFVDWGLDKDLLVPFSEQEKPMSEGLHYVVCVFQDEDTQRIAASTKLNQFLQETNTDFTEKQEVELLISGRTDMGYKAVINNSHLGLIFRDEVIKPLRIGQHLRGFIQRIREDGKIDLCFQFHDKQARKTLSEQIIEDLIAHGGISTLTDKSSAEEISQRFNVSKNAYKKAIGGLYKQKRILLDKTKVTLIED
jgi:predicted RNA-binding protein (virulence factor B family)